MRKIKTCLDCGQLYGQSLFIWVDDDLWKSLGLRRYDYLCSHCLINRVEKSNFYGYLALRKSADELINKNCNKIHRAKLRLKEQLKFNKKYSINLQKDNSLL